MISVRFQGKPFNTTVIQVYVLTRNAEECGQESLRRNGVAIIINKRVRNAVFPYNLKNGRTISVHFQGKPCNTTVIQVYALTSNAEEVEVERFYEDRQDLLELVPRKDVLFIIAD